MSTPSPQTTDWLPKARAAALLGISPRQLERRAHQGFIQKMTGPRNPTERNPPVFYCKADILALKAGTPNTHATPVSDDPEPVAESRELAVTAPRSRDPFAGLAEHLARIAGAFPAPIAAPRPWLTLAEAAEYSGLPKSFLMAIAHRGGDRALSAAGIAMNVGTDKKALWRFNRDALNTLKAGR